MVCAVEKASRTSTSARSRSASALSAEDGIEATAASTAMIATTTSSSIMVKPLGRRGAAGTGRIVARMAASVRLVVVDDLGQRAHVRGRGHDREHGRLAGEAEVQGGGPVGLLA